MRNVHRLVLFSPSGEELKSWSVTSWLSLYREPVLNLDSPIESGQLVRELVRLLSEYTSTPEEA